MERLKGKGAKDEHELSLIERILANEKNPKTAAIFALDLILVGIDTVFRLINIVYIDNFSFPVSISIMLPLLHIFFRYQWQSVQFYIN